MVITMMNQINIPAKSTFKQNEVCQITGVKPYVLKFWEEQFEEINPITSATGKKLYEHGDIQAIALVKQLLFDEKLSIDDAKTEIKLRLSQTVCESEVAEAMEENTVSSNEVQNSIEEQLSTTQLNSEQSLDVQVQHDLEEFEQSLSNEIEPTNQAASPENKVHSESKIEAGSILDQVIEKKAAEKKSNEKRLFENKPAKIKKSQLTDKDKQNLVLAKAKLQNMLMMTNQIKSRQNIQ